MSVKKTKRLLIVRHGQYNKSDMSLDMFGRRQIAGISNKIASIVKDKSVIILSSISKRASESAAIIAYKLGVGFEEHDVLWSQNDHPEDLEKAFSLVKSNIDKADVIILVTHYEYTERFPKYFAKEYLKTDISSRCIENGCMWDLCWENEVVIQAITPFVVHYID